MTQLARTCCIAVAVASYAATAAAQEAANNGTNPTLLTRSTGIQWKYTDLGAGLSNGLMEAHFTQPFGATKNMSIGITVPYASGALDGDYGLGDFSVKFTHVPIVTSTYGVAYTAEVFFDTASRRELGNGHEVGKFSGFYVNFLRSGIIAPALVQEVSLGEVGRLEQRVNRTTFDLYYVPKLGDPRFFVTFDPAITRDWQKETTYGSLTTTFGMVVGKVMGGDGQVFVKPQVLIGGERAADWSLQAGFKVLNF